MSLTHMLALSGAMDHRPSGPSPYQFRDSSPARRFLADRRSKLGAAERELSGVPGFRLGTDPDRRVNDWRPSWLKTAFLLALLFFCTGVVKTNSLHQQKQLFALGQHLSLQEARAEQFRWQSRWYRARLAVEQRALDAGIQPYPPPTSKKPTPRTLPGSPDGSRLPPSKLGPQPAVTVLAAREAMPLTGLAQNERTAPALAVSHPFRTN